MKKGQIAIFIIIGLFFVGALVFFVWLKSENRIAVSDRECTVDSDCVPDVCCDAKLCVPINEGPDCLGERISQEDDVKCPPGCAGYLGDATGKKFLGCSNDPRGTGSCRCINEKCTPVWQ